MDTNSKKSVSARSRAGARFTTTTVAALPVGTYTDPSTAGLQFRVTARGTGKLTRSWLLRFRFATKDCRILLGHPPLTSLADARRAALELREKLAQGIDPRRATARQPRGKADLQVEATKLPKHTVGALAADFVARRIRPRLKHPEQVEQRLARHVLSEWKHRDARTIETVDVTELCERIADGGSPVEANRVKALISQMFDYSRVRGTLKHNPVVRGFQPGGPEKPRERVLTDDELRVIVSDPMGAVRLQRTAHAMMVLLATGARRGELAKAEWKDVNLAGGWWRIPPTNAKNGLEHDFPLTDLAVEHLTALRGLAHRSRWVMPALDGDGPIDPKLLTRSVARCGARLKRQKVAPFNVHDLRRTVRTGLGRLGVRPDIAELVIGHKRSKLIETYDRHRYPEERRDALERWSAHLATLVVKA